MKNKTEQVHTHSQNTTAWRVYWPVILSLILLLAGLAADHFKGVVFKDPYRLSWYILAYLPVGWPVIRAGWEQLFKGNFFTEFFLMAIATLGAFYIGEYPEAVAVMLFYAIGELFQGAAVRKAKHSIKALLDVRPKEALVYRNDTVHKVGPEEVKVGEIIQVRLGEKIPLDGILLSAKTALNTAALTGESKPRTVRANEAVYAGSINLEHVIKVEVTKSFDNSSIARILALVQSASERKSKTELFIRKFAKIYTPIVVFLALGLIFIPALFVEAYVFKDWLYRGLVFLVISCPCALVISIPLGYFGGLGAASRNGILFKGATFLDKITTIDTVVLDKTGTLTKGVFAIQNIEVLIGKKADFMAMVMAVEKQSTHPIAKAILAYPYATPLKATAVQEIAGQGLRGKVNEVELMIGNERLFSNEGITVPTSLSGMAETVVYVAFDHKYAGFISIADELKEDAARAVQALAKVGIRKLVMLSGDKTSVVQDVARKLGIPKAFGDLSPEDKLRHVEKMQERSGTKVAFVGDGINDAPVLAISDIGIAMGGLGSDVAIETADLIIQADEPTKIAQAVSVGRSTRRIVWQNIILAFGVKLIVLLLGAGGLATLWEAVFADVGVALLAILNAVRLQRMTWN